MIELIINFWFLYKASKFVIVGIMFLKFVNRECETQKITKSQSQNFIIIDIHKTKFLKIEYLKTQKYQNLRVTTL